jgi:hypothetical protein
MQIEMKEADFGQGPFDPSALLAAGWTYMDPPTRFSHEMLDLWCDTIGRDNYRLLAMTDGIQSDGFKFKRGQFLVNPEGIKRLKEYAAANKTTGA